MTNAPLTQERLEAIRQRAEKATAGATPEWYVDDDYTDTVRCSWSANLIAQGIQNISDAEFIAHARQDIPDLLAEIERLRSIALELLEAYASAEDTVINDRSTSFEYDWELLEEEVENYRKSIIGGEGYSTFKVTNL